LEWYQIICVFCNVGALKNTGLLNPSLCGDADLTDDSFFSILLLMKVKGLILCFVVVVMSNPIGRAEIILPALFSDHAVLQKSDQVPVWGWAESGEAVSVLLNGIKAKTVAAPDGSWKVLLNLRTQGPGPYELVVEGKNRIVVSDVLVGEVWLCSGQSNMEWPVSHSLNFEAEAAAATDSNIREFQVPHTIALGALKKASGKWVIASSTSIGSFGAVGYFFGRELRARLQVPVGLISCSWGGTPAEAWTPLSAMEGVDIYKPLLDRRAQVLQPAPEMEVKGAKKLLLEWELKLKKLLATDSQPDQVWFEPGFSLRGWVELQAPGMVDTQIKPVTDGSYWLRKVIELPVKEAAEKAELHLGPLDDFDVTWVNGVQVGRTGPENVDAWKTPRVYPVPAGILRPGTNVIIVRLVDQYASGGFSGNAQDLYLVTSFGEKVSLAGSWQGRLETDLGIKPELGGPQLQNIAGTLYDGMISPLIPYAMCGVIWYQGESNADRAIQYRSLFPAMITSWRKAWGQGDFPFYYVQLANFMLRQPEPGESSWAELREAQRQTLKVPHTGMAVAIDIGDDRDIHPKNKQEVGRRLALIALSKDYNIRESNEFWSELPWIGKWFQKPLVYSGPMYRESKREGSRMRIFFDHVGSGLVNAGGGASVKGFALAGGDGQFFWAEAMIEGESMVVSSPKVTEPVAARYGWADNPEVSLVNKQGLPASPFRTDDFPAITQGRN
jgi:sialate O-acetylesterase